MYNNFFIRKSRFNFLVSTEIYLRILPVDINILQHEFPFSQKLTSEPRHEKTGFLHMGKQSRRSALRKPRGRSAKLISAFVFRYIASTIPLFPKYKISSL